MLTIHSKNGKYDVQQAIKIIGLALIVVDDFDVSMPGGNTEGKEAVINDLKHAMMGLNNLLTDQWV